MSNRRRRPRHAQPLSSRRHHRLSPADRPPVFYSIGFYDPDGDEIEITVDINDPGVDPVLVDIIRLMTDTCPLCNGDHQEDGHQ